MLRGQFTGIIFGNKRPWTDSPLHTDLTRPNLLASMRRLGTLADGCCIEVMPCATEWVSLSRKEGSWPDNEVTLRWLKGDDASAVADRAELAEQMFCDIV